jgi:hypothetical protein
VTSTVDLLTAISGHLTEFELPAIASVHVAAYQSGPQVSVQLACREPSAIAGGLLAWADTLAEVSAEAWRVPGGQAVHLSMTGLLPGGAAVLIYGGLTATSRGLGADLAPNASAPIPLAALRHTATLKEAST